MTDSDKHFRNWLDEITEQVDAAARAAGEAAAEEVRATAIVAALNTSRRLQTKIATDSIKQAQIFEKNDDQIENLQTNPETHLISKNQINNNDNEKPLNKRSVHFKSVDYPKRCEIFNNVPLTRGNYYDFVSKNYSYEPRNYPYFYPPHNIHSSFSAVENNFDPRKSFGIYQSNQTFYEIKTKAERIKNHFKEIFSNKK